MIIKVDKKTEKGLIKLASEMKTTVETLCYFILGSDEIEVLYSGSPDKREVLHTLPSSNQAAEYQSGTLRSQNSNVLD